MNVIDDELLWQNQHKKKSKRINFQVLLHWELDVIMKGETVLLHVN